MAFQFARVAPLLTLALAVLSTQHQHLQVLGADSSGSSASTTTNATAAAMSVGSTSDLIGWFNCSAITFKDQQNTADSFRQNEGYDSIYGSDSTSLNTYARKAQCAQYQAPLCHAGICDDTQDRTVDVFVKRVLAREKPESKPNVWFFQGGPGYASPTMEYGMRALYIELDGQVNVYTMDHRGTGRSNPLDCVAAQATTSGSPLGSDIDVSELSKCAQELQTKYGDMAAFSVTSAATDISTFISKYQSGSKTFVYGVSYGSALVERLIHLDTTEIVGYILDGVSTTSGAKVEDGMYMPNWDTNFDEVATRFLDLLSKNSKKAKEKFKSKSISSVLEKVIKEMDKKPSSKCAKVITDYVASTQPSSSASALAPASHYLRQILGRLLMNTITRAYIPVIIYRLERCSKDDRSVLSYFMKAIDEILSTPSEEEALVSILEYYLIVFSEMWESPSPDLDTLLSRFTDAKISSGPIASFLPLYCAFTKDTSAACTSLVNATALGSGPALAYKKDKYWNVAAKIPTQASVLIMSGKLDPQTPHKYAERLYDALDGTKKELVAFQFTPHGALLNAVYGGAVNEWGFILSKQHYCGVELIASYVKNGGDLSKVNKSCVAPTDASMSDLNAVGLYEYAFLGTRKNMYDGELYEYYSTELKTPLIVVSVVGCLLFLSLANHLHSKRRARARASAAARGQAQELDGVQGSPTHETAFAPSDDARTVGARV